MCKKPYDDFSFIFKNPALKHSLEKKSKHIFEGETPEQIAADDKMIAELEKKVSNK